MDTALPQKIPFILDRNLAKANCTGNRVCTSCDIVVLDCVLKHHLVRQNRNYHNTVKVVAIMVPNLMNTFCLTLYCLACHIWHV